MAKIFAASAIFSGNLAADGARLRKHLVGKTIGQMMLADHDFDIHSEIARTPDDFEDASGGRNSRAREARELHIDDGAVKFGKSLQTARVNLL
jgi:hypothetical protein